MSFSLSTQCHMSFTFLNELPSPAEIKQNYPLSDKLKALKKERDAAISAIITGADSRFLVIIGPCSADNEDSVCDYVSRLTSIQEDVADKLILIPRVYTNKPRTTGEGYKGIASQPDPEKAPDMIEGLIAMHSRDRGKRSYLRRRDALPGELGLCGRPVVLCRHRRAFRRGSAAPSHRERF